MPHWAHDRGHNGQIGDGVRRDFRIWGFDRRGWSLNTADQYAHRVEQCDRWLKQRGRRVEWADTRELQDWLSTLPRTPSSRNHARKALLAFYAYLIDQGRRRSNPADGIDPLPIPKGLPRPCPAPGELLAAARDRGPMWHCAVALMLYAGLRFSEARLLEWGDARGGWLAVTGKGARDRSVALHPVLAGVLMRWRGECPDPRWVFPSAVLPDRPMSGTTLHKGLRAIAADAGYPDVTAHMLRHRFATATLQRTGNLAATQELLGHSSPATTRIYAAVEAEQLKEAVEAVEYEDS